MDRRLIVLLTLLSTALAAYHLTRREPLRAATAVAASSLTLIAPAVTKRRRRRIDGRLVDAVIHMYAVSLGQTQQDEIIGIVAETGVYGYYAKVFKRIRYLARGLGYGFTRAMLLVAETVEQPLKDILV
jgi:archaellum biogenesis protein FlaJ (TadC family)